jgi:hypothetical protein
MTPMEIHDIGTARFAGVRALWVKVIIRAVFDWVTYKDAADLRQLKLAQGASVWLFSKSELFNSFENVCYYLDLNPDNIRTWAATLTRDQVVKIEHLQREPTRTDLVALIPSRSVMHKTNTFVR